MNLHNSMPRAIENKLPQRRSATSKRGEDLIEEALKQTSGNKAKAAEALRDFYPTLYRKIENSPCPLRFLFSSTIKDCGFPPTMSFRHQSAFLTGCFEKRIAAVIASPLLPPDRGAAGKAMLSWRHLKQARDSAIRKR
jgi:hypothetical protein